VTVNSKEENSEDFCMDFIPEFDLWKLRKKVNEPKEGQET
jgi:hypothetical protein